MGTKVTKDGKSLRKQERIQDHTSHSWRNDMRCSVNMDVSEFATAVVPVIAKMDSTSQSLIAGIVLIASISGMPELNAMLPMNMLKTRILNCIRLF